MVYRPRLGGSMVEDGSRPRARRDTCTEVCIHRLQPQHRAGRRGAVDPQQPEVRTATRVVREGGVANQYDLVACVAQQRQQALPLEIEAVGGATNFSGPPETKLPFRILVNLSHTHGVGASGGRG